LHGWSAGRVFFTAAVNLLNRLIGAVVAHNQVVTVLRKYLESAGLTFYLGYVTQSQIGHRTVGHNDILAIKSVDIAS